MKKYGLLLFTALMVVCSFTSCSDDDDENVKDILGKWKFKNMEAGEVKTSDPAATAAIKDYISYDDDDYIIEFMKNGKVKYYDGEDEDDSYTASYAISGNKITMKYEGRGGTFEFKINGNTLSFYYDITEEVEDERSWIDGVDEDVTIEKVIQVENLIRE